MQTTAYMVSKDNIPLRLAIWEVNHRENSIFNILISFVKMQKEGCSYLNLYSKDNFKLSVG